MAQIVVRNLAEAARNRLRDQARKHGRSMEEEVRCILRRAVPVAAVEERGWGTRVARRFSGQGLSGEIPEWRGTPACPADLGS